MGEAAWPGWSTRLRLVEVGCCGYVANSTVSLLSELVIKWQNLRHAAKNMTLVAEQASAWLWRRRNHAAWSAVSLAWLVWLRFLSVGNVSC